MPRKKLGLIQNAGNAAEDCFAFRLTKAGNPSCIALNDIYCLKGDAGCVFKATPGEASVARLRAQKRLAELNRG